MAKCKICDAHALNTVCHWLATCTALTDHREQTMQQFLNQCPAAMQVGLLQMQPSEFTEFLLSGMRSSYVREYYTIYEGILDFVLSVYRARQEKQSMIAIVIPSDAINERTEP